MKIRPYASAALACGEQSLLSAIKYLDVEINGIVVLCIYGCGLKLPDYVDSYSFVDEMSEGAGNDTLTAGTREPGGKYQVVV